MTDDVFAQIMQPRPDTTDLVRSLMAGRVSTREAVDQLLIRPRMTTQFTPRPSSGDTITDFRAVMEEAREAGHTELAATIEEFLREVEPILSN